MAEYVGLIHRFDTQKETIQVGSLILPISAGLLKNVIQHFQVGDLVVVKYSGRKVTSVIRKEDEHEHAEL